MQSENCGICTNNCNLEDVRKVGVSSDEYGIAVIIRKQMLMCAKEARIDRQHHTIPNQRLESHSYIYYLLKYFISIDVKKTGEIVISHW